MSDLSMPGLKSRAGSRGDPAVLLGWAIVSLVLSALWMFGYVPNGDDDDLHVADHAVQLLPCSHSHLGMVGAPWRPPAGRGPDAGVRSDARDPRRQTG